jgi:hypothetical protein
MEISDLGQIFQALGLNPILAREFERKSAKEFRSWLKKLLRTYNLHFHPDVSGDDELDNDFIAKLNQAANAINSLTDSELITQLSELAKTANPNIRQMLFIQEDNERLQTEANQLNENNRLLTNRLNRSRKTNRLAIESLFLTANRFIEDTLANNLPISITDTAYMAFATNDLLYYINGRGFVYFTEWPKKQLQPKNIDEAINFYSRQYLERHDNNRRQHKKIADYEFQGLPEDLRSRKLKPGLFETHEDGALRKLIGTCRLNEAEFYQYFHAPEAFVNPEEFRKLLVKYFEAKIDIGNRLVIQVQRNALASSNPKRIPTIMLEISAPIIAGRGPFFIHSGQIKSKDPWGVTHK